MTSRALTTLAAAAWLTWGIVASGCAAFEDRDQAASESTTTPGGSDTSGQATGSSSPESTSGAATSASPSGTSGATPSASPYDSSTSGGAAPSEAEPSASPQ